MGVILSILFFILLNLFLKTAGYLTISLITESEEFKDFYILMTPEPCAPPPSIVTFFFIISFLSCSSYLLGKHKYVEHEIARAGDYNHMTYPK
jgi:hypothetical protein